MNRWSLLKWELRYACQTYGLWRIIVVGFMRVILDMRDASTREYYIKPHLALPPKTKKRIMLVSADNSEGSGAFACLLNLAKTLHRMGEFKVVVVFPYHGVGEKILGDLGIANTVVRMTSWRIRSPSEIQTNAWGLIASLIHNYFAVRYLARVIEESHIDLVHVNTSTTYIGALAAKITNRPIVWHLREAINKQGGCMINTPMSYALISESNRIISVSNWIREAYQDCIDKRLVSTVHDGVDENRFYRSQHEIFTDKVARFVFVGNFQAKKFQYQFAQACVKLYEQGYKDFRVCFVGRGVKEGCGELFEKVGMSDLIEYAGFQKEPVKFQEKSDIAFMCSLVEAFGLVTVEAQLAGCLVIGANAGATPEIIKHGETGLLFEFDGVKVDDLVEKMKYALTHRDEMRVIAKRGQEEALKNFTLQINAEKISKIYEEVLNER